MIFFPFIKRTSNNNIFSISIIQFTIWSLWNIVIRIKINMKEKKDVKIDFRTTELIKHEAREVPFSYEEVFLAGLKVLRDDDSFLLVRIGELEEELRCLREELGEMEGLK